MPRGHQQKELVYLCFLLLVQKKATPICTKGGRQKRHSWTCPGKEWVQMWEDPPCPIQRFRSSQRMPWQNALLSHNPEMCTWQEVDVFTAGTLPESWDSNNHGRMPFTAPPCQSSGNVPSSSAHIWNDPGLFSVWGGRWTLALLPEQCSPPECSGSSRVPTGSHTVWPRSAFREPVLFLPLARRRDDWEIGSILVLRENKCIEAVMTE